MNKELRPSVFKRVIGLLVDFIFFGLIGFLLSFFLEEFFVSLGVYGSLVGTLIVVIYYGITQSEIGEGQSLGKKSINAKVVTLNGEYLSAGQSCLRAFILFFPVMNFEMFSTGKIGTIVLIILFTVILVTVYLLFINKSRRALHDIFLKSVVVKSEVEEFDIKEQNDRSSKKLIPIGIIAGLMILIFTYLTFSDTGFGHLTSLKSAVENQKGVVTVNKVEYSRTTYYGEDAPTTFSSINLIVRISNEQEATNANSKYFDDFYKLVAQNIPDIEEFDGVIITLYWGYNIGIYRKSISTTKTMEIKVHDN